MKIIMAELSEIRPKDQYRVMDLVKAAGVDVSDWGNFKGGERKAACNPKYCYEWSFMEPQKVVVLNLWYESMQVQSEVIFQSLNYRQIADEFDEIPGRSVWKKRALKMDQAFQEAMNLGLPVRVIICEGPRRGVDQPKSEASRVQKRLLDEMPWAVTYYDCETGLCTLTRGAFPFSSIDPTMNETPPAVRILPMANDLEKEFPGCTSIEDVQQNYFLSELPSRENGSYYYHKRGLQAEPGTMVLFQCQGCIIASASLTGMQRFEKPTDDGYFGCINFNVMSIRTFKPMTADVIGEIWPCFKGFSMAKQDLDPANYSEFKKRLELVMQPEVPPPTQEATDLVAPPERVHEQVYRILRDSELARRVKQLNDYRCQICGHTIEIPNGGFYAEAHHIQPLGQPHNGPDVIGNIVCVCPNHHAELDYGVIALSLPSLRHSSEHNIDAKYTDYHNQIILKSANV